MPKRSQDDLTEAKQIVAKMLSMPPKPHRSEDKPATEGKASQSRRTNGSARARVGKAKD